ncbi:MAG: anthranilate synthase component I family protein [Chitinophagales bacterium]
MKQATSTNCIFPVTDFTQVKNKVLNWANQFSTFCFLDNHQYTLEPHSAECLVAAGRADFIQANAGMALNQLQKFTRSGKRWLFGHLGYDLKNEIENVHSAHPDLVQFPDLFFFQPEIVIRFDKDEMIIESETDDVEEIFHKIISSEHPDYIESEKIIIQSRIDKDEYISIIQKLREHILRGDCYEINFCQEFFAENTVVDPLKLFKKLSAVSPNPFSGFYKLNDKYLLCASPERFLKKQENKILSQPIKGTSKRMLDKHRDAESKMELFRSSKDRSENVMIVDLVRNDLSKICREGTIKVDELYGVYSFPQVHQMISTVSGELRNDVCFSEIIRSTFPMGSMTGAPKKKVLELIEQYEKTKRGIFSGALGYIDPEGDFDFNVVIRSIMYNAGNKYLSFQTGSGITFYSEAEKEWEECSLKAKAIREVLES